MVKTAIRTSLEDQLTRVQALITSAYAALLSASADSSGIASFELDTGEADQKVTFKSVNKLQAYLDVLERKEEWLIRRLGGCAITSVRVRRKP